MTLLNDRALEIKELSLYQDYILSGQAFIQNATKAIKRHDDNDNSLQIFVDDCRKFVKNIYSRCDDKNKLKSELLLLYLKVESLDGIRYSLSKSWLYHAESLYYYCQRQGQESLNSIHKSIENDSYLYTRYNDLYFFVDSHMMLLSRLISVSGKIKDYKLFEESCNFMFKAMFENIFLMPSELSCFTIQTKIIDRTSKKRMRWLLSLITNQALSYAMTSYTCRMCLLNSLNKYTDKCSIAQIIFNTFKDIINNECFDQNIFSIKYCYPYNLWILPSIVYAKKATLTHKEKINYIDSINLNSFHHHIIPKHLYSFIVSNTKLL